MAIQNKGEALKIKGMLLKIDRNTRSAKGFYYTNEIKTEKYEVAQDNQKYPVKMINNKFISTEEVKEENIKKKSKTLSFLRNIAILKI